MILSLTVHATDRLECKYKAVPKSSIVISVDESTSTTDVVLLAISEAGTVDKTKSIILPRGAFAQQLTKESVIIPFADDADPNEYVFFDASLFAVSKNATNGNYDGYVTIYDDGIAIMAVTCTAK